MIGDTVEIYIPEGKYNYLITKVFPTQLHISPIDRFGEISALIQVRGEWKVDKFEREHSVKIIPRRIKIPRNYNSQIVLTGKDKLRSSLGGMTIEQLEASSLVFLSHVTYDIYSIIKSWKLDHRLSLSRSGVPVHPGISGPYYGEKPTIEVSGYKQKQYPGIYTKPISQIEMIMRNYGKYPITPGYVTLILSLSLLEQRNWHLNCKDNYGSINEWTFTPETLPKYLSTLKPLWGINQSKDGNLWDPEVIFHDAISLDLVEAILVNTDEQKIAIEEEIKGRIPVFVGSHDLYKEFASRKFYKGGDRLNSAPPQYCYTGILGDWAEEGGPYGSDAVEFRAENPYTLNILKIDDEKIKEENDYIWQKRLELCGITERYTPERKEELFKAIEDRMQKLYFEDAQRTPVQPGNHPPWKYTPEYYRIQFHDK